MPENTEKKRRQVSGTIDGDLADRLAAEADARFVSPSWLIEAALRDFLPRLPALPTTGEAAG